MYKEPLDDICIDIQPREEENIIKVKKEDVFKEVTKQKIKMCEVCGDTTLGCNYGVHSCASCKAFFWRNWHNDSLFGHCDGNCDVTVISRASCRKCRLNKCYMLGMKRNIMNNDAVYNNRISSISTFSPQDEIKSPQRKFKETIVKLYNDRLLKQVISREEKVPILGTMNFIN